MIAPPALSPAVVEQIAEMARERGGSCTHLQDVEALQAFGEEIARLALQAHGWQPIETVPKDYHDVIDLWCVGEHDDIAFYCSESHGGPGALSQGRVVNVWWRDGAWRPKSRLKLHALTVTPTHWSRPLPAPPESAR